MNEYKVVLFNRVNGQRETLPCEARSKEELNDWLRVNFPDHSLLEVLSEDSEEEDV